MWKVITKIPLGEYNLFATLKEETHHCKLAISHFIIHLCYCHKSVERVILSETVAIGGWAFDTIVTIILLNHLYE